MKKAFGRSDMVLDRKIAFVDLEKRTTTIVPVPLALRRTFLGGRGLNRHVLSRSDTAHLDPFSPKNPLIFGAGLPTRTLGFGSRVNITSKSPESGHLGDANLGGDFGAELVKAELSHLIITGKSPKPVYPHITNRSVTIRDARELQGLDTAETQRKIRRDLKDPKTQIACIGPAGENLVRFASIRSGLKSAAGRTGMGAVMGAKNLKTVALRGTLDREIFDPRKCWPYYLARLRRLMRSKWVQTLGIVFKAKVTWGASTKHPMERT
jgi:aldehyde:ferredoxin oxidoreductase